MRQGFEEYIAHSKEIRSLSMPPEETGKKAGEFYRVFNENFGKIKVLLQENRKILDREVFRPLKKLDNLSLDGAAELMDFAENLADTKTLEMVDVRLAWLILKDLSGYYERKYQESATAQLQDQYIFCLYKLLAISYNVIQVCDKGRATDELTSVYRSAILKAEDILRTFRQTPEQFGELSENSQDKMMECALFRGTAYERLYYDEEAVRNQIACYEECLQILKNPDMQKAAPKYDWKFQIFSTDTYLSLVNEYLYWNRVPEDILLRLRSAAEEALAYARENPDNYRQNQDTIAGTLRSIQGYLGEISIPEMLQGYEEWIKGADPNGYDWMAMENNMLPVVFTQWLCQARPEWMDVCKNFLRWTQKWTFNYISNARDKGAYECMQRFTSYIMDAYIEIEGGISFRHYYEKILIVTQPTLYVHCRMVTKIAICILDALYAQNPESLLYANGCETMEQVHDFFLETREFLFNCCMFHDAGKLYFLDTINMYGRMLFSEEFDLIRLHPIMGWELLNKRESTRPYAEAALYHHLWYDEKGGYPREYTFKGNDNAILYQIITCADCLDAATDSVGRAYSSGKNFEEMLADLRCNSGRMFNPDLVELFDDEALQEKVKHLITVEREQLYLDVFGKNVEMVW